MGCGDAFKIVYIGGGSRFVVHVLHGLAKVADQLKALRRPIQLELVDPNRERTAEMVRYAEITARQTGLPLSARWTVDRADALKDADWVLLSVGLWARLKEAEERYAKPFLAPYGELNAESGPGMAIEAAAVWALLREVAPDVQRLAPRAVFTTLMNPTDVLAPAVERQWGVRSIGLCVEVPQLWRWLAMHLRVDMREIQLEHLGVNHFGWVSRWTVGGADGAPLLKVALEEAMQRPDWSPQNDEFAQVFLATGFMRTSAYHYWPYARESGAERRRRAAESVKHGPYPKGDGPQQRRALLDKAFAEGTMVPEDRWRIDSWAMPYLWPTSRLQLGTLAVGLAGGAAGPVPMQAPNGASNPSIPPDIWIEAPTRIACGRVIPQTVPALPGWMLDQIRLVAAQRSLLAEWLRGAAPNGLREALLCFPHPTPLPELLKLAEELPALRDSAL